MFRSTDHRVYCENGLSSQYDKIGMLNLFMQCDELNLEAFSKPLEGYTIRNIKDEEIEIWKSVVAEEQYRDYLTEYYNRVYVKAKSEFIRRCFFVCKHNKEAIASVLI